MTEDEKIKLRPIQYMAFLAMALLYGGDLFQVYAKEPSKYAYLSLAAIGLGVNVPELRRLLLKFLNLLAEKP